MFERVVIIQDEGEPFVLRNETPESAALICLKLACDALAGQKTPGAKALAEAVAEIGQEFLPLLDNDDPADEQDSGGFTWSREDRAQFADIGRRIGDRVDQIAVDSSAEKSRRAILFVVQAMMLGARNRIAETWRAIANAAILAGQATQEALAREQKRNAGRRRHSATTKAKPEVKAFAEASPDLSLDEIADTLAASGSRAERSTIRRWLTEMGISKDPRRSVLR